MLKLIAPYPKYIDKCQDEIVNYIYCFFIIKETMQWCYYHNVKGLQVHAGIFASALKLSIFFFRLD